VVSNFVLVSVLILLFNETHEYIREKNVKRSQILDFFSVDVLWELCTFILCKLYVLTRSVEFS
jgi:hypothetical protein